MKPDEIACPVPGCNSTFLRKGNLIHHYRRFHPEQTYQQHSSFRWIVENDQGDGGGELDYAEDYGEDMMLEDLDTHGDVYPNEFSMQFRDYVLDEAALLSLPSDTTSSSALSSNGMDDRHYNPIDPFSNLNPQQSPYNPNAFPAQLFSNNFRPPTAVLPPMYNMPDPNMMNNNNNLFNINQVFPTANDFLLSTMRTNSDEMILSNLRPLDDGIGRVPSDESLQLAAIANSVMDYTMQ
jgi:hypothetical protein